MGKSPPEKTQLAELTLRDIANAGADLHEFAAVVPFTLEGNWTAGLYSDISAAVLQPQGET